MPVIKTNNNRVVADDPEPDDCFVQVVWFGQPQDGLHTKVFHGPMLPVEDYDEAVAWARGMAEYMAHPLYVVPLTGVEMLRNEHVKRAVAALTDQQRGELRQHLVATLAGILRDCDDYAVRAHAHDILVQMKVVRP